MWMFMMLCIVCSVVASVIVTKILATHYFEIADGYVKEMTELTKEYIERISAKADKL